jgi:rod shape-determining protein MreC
VQSGSVDRLEGAAKLLWQGRSVALTLTTPIYLIAEAPYTLYGSAADISIDRQSLLQQREQLSAKLLRLEEGQQRVLFLQAENARLRQLLGSKAQLPSQATIAEIIGVPPDPNRAAVILDKGQDDGVQPGHAVVDAQGLFGQVVDVSSSTSWVILITDRKHAIPARNNRTGVRMIVGGIGVSDRLVLEDLPASTDVQDGDLIETSGLGGRFPPGYPVGTVASVEVTQDSPYLQAALTPAAALFKIGHVLVIAPSEVPEDIAGNSVSETDEEPE